MKEAKLTVRALALLVSMVICLPLCIVVPELAMHLYGKAQEMVRELEEDKP